MDAAVDSEHPHASTPSGGNARRKAPTIIDVARLANASKSTVSNVLQGKAHVNEQTRQRVLQAIAELGYRTNVSARYMRQRSRVLGVVVGDLRNPFHAEIAAFIEQSANAAQHTILLATTSGVAEREAGRVQTLIEHRVAAVLFVSFSGDASVLDAIPEDTPPLFVSFPSRAATYVSVDQQQGTRLAVEHLLSLGHTRIAYASTTLTHEAHADRARYSAYRRTLERHRIDARGLPELHLAEDSEAEAASVKDRLAQMLTRRDRPTAIFAASDFTALEIIEAADAVGLEIPRDLSLVGFDDIAIAGLSRISLTTVAQPMAQMADRAVRLALRPLTAPRPRSVRLPAKLVIRDSTAPLRARR